MAAAAALVGTMATDAWQTARSAAVRLFRRLASQERRDITARLDADRRLLLHTSPADHARTRDELTLSWARRLDSLLEDDPDTVGELEAVVAEIQGTPALGPEARSGPVQHRGRTSPAVHHPVRQPAYQRRHGLTDQPR